MTKLRFLISILFIALALGGTLQLVQSGEALEPAPPPLAAPDDTAWLPVADGVAYRIFFQPDPGPNSIYVARMDRSNPNVILETSLGQGRLSGGVETVKNMAARYDQAINHWGGSWGARNNVVVAVNGSFFDGLTGIPNRGMVHSGWYAKRFDDLENGSGFIWKADRSAYVGQCVNHRTDKQFVTYLANSQTQTFNGINVPRGDDELILYTAQYDTDTGTDPGLDLWALGAEVLVEMRQPTSIMYPEMATGVIREIRNGASPANIPFDYIVLSAQGEARTTLLQNAKVGDEIGISQKVTHYDSDCETRIDDEEWENAYASLGGSYNYIKDGVIQYFDDGGAIFRHPRTAIAYNNQYLYFIVVDGRQSGSVGMTIAELAVFTQNTLGAAWAIAQDGGGSSTMVVNGIVVNAPRNAYCDNVFLPLVIQGSGGPAAAPPDFAPQTNPCVVERSVANGIMMVLVEPVEQSTAFALGAAVVTLAETDLRLGPGTNYGMLETIPQETPGVVLAHFNLLDGVLATGAYWWKVDFAGAAGWVPEDALAHANP